MKYNKRPFLVWDTCQLSEDEIKYRLTESDDERNQLQEDETEDERKERIQNEVWQDSDFIQFEWETEMDYLTEVLQKMNPGGAWRADVNNFGWQHLSGSKEFKAETGSEFLREVLPDTDCTFSIYKMRNGKGVVINNSHHDAMNEMYYIRPMSADVLWRNNN